MERYIVVVDGISAGKHIAPAAMNKGYRCIHVRSRPEYGSFFDKGFPSENYEEDILFDENTANRLKPFHPVAVFNGSEFSPETADRLASALGVHGNDPKYSFLKRNKHAMQTTISAANLESIKHTFVRSSVQAIEWSVSHGSWPVVIKPNQSMGTNGVKFCYSCDDIEKYFNQHHMKADPFGNINTHFLVQEFLHGKEFIVNFVSFGGKHSITEMWQLSKRKVVGYGYIYDNDILIDVHHPAFAEIRDYGASVLDALHVVYGPTHMEVMLTARGPVLIEVGARLQGSTSFNALSRCLECHQLDWLMSVLDHDTSDTWQPNTEYVLQNHLMWVQLISEQTGILRAVPLAESLARLGSWHELALYYSVGDRIHNTVDLFSSPGSIFLVNATADGLRTDLERIRCWEKEGGYLVDPI